MDSKVAFLTKDKYGSVELWPSQPVKEDGAWYEKKGSTEVGSEILDGLLDDYVEPGECVKIQITKI